MALTATGTNLDLLLPGTPAPRLAALFLPRHAPPGSYHLSVLGLPLDEARGAVQKALGVNAESAVATDAWKTQQLDPLEAFGAVGLYDRSRLARLYTGKPASVIRGPVERDGRVVASVTLISPYPDAELTRLLPGTLAILFDVERARRADRSAPGRVP